MHQSRQIAPAVIAIDEHGDEEGPDAGHRAGFDRGEHAGKDAAEDDHQGDQTPQRLDRNLHRLPHRHRRAARMTVAIRDHQTQHHQREAEQQARHHAGHEQADDRNRAAGRQRIDHRIVAGRHQQRLHRRGDGHVGGKDLAPHVGIGVDETSQRTDRRRVHEGVDATELGRRLGDGRSN